MAQPPTPPSDDPHAPPPADGSWRARLGRARDRAQRSVLGAISARFVELDLPTHAASLTFYSLVSLTPLLVLVLWLAASLQADAQATLLTQIGELAGPEAQAVAATVLRHAGLRPDVGSLAGALGTAVLFVGATTVFARLQGTLNLIFRTDGAQLGGLLAWLRKRVFSFGVVFALGFLIVASTLLSALLDLLFADLPVLAGVADGVVSPLVYILAFALLYHYLPDRRVRWRQAWIGAAITTVLFLLGRWVIAWYLARAAPGSAYGSMGALVIMLVWMYYAALVFFAGALVTAVIDERSTTRDGVPAQPPAGHAASAPPGAG